MNYDAGVVPIPVIRPVSEKTGDKYPKVETPTRIDELVVQKLRKLGIVPSDVCDDHEFLRRASLDLTGTLPAPQEVVDFLSEPRLEQTSQEDRRTAGTPRLRRMVVHQAMRLHR